METIVARSMLLLLLPMALVMETAAILPPLAQRRLASSHETAVRQSLSLLDITSPKDVVAKQQPGISGPVSVQVAEEDLHNLLGGLSEQCSARINQTLRGEAAAIHTFGTEDRNATKASCTELEGSFCQTNARMVHENDHADKSGREMKATIDVSGDSCLPKECAATEDDMMHLGQFLHSSVGGMLPSKNTKVVLEVDCSESGGGKITLGHD
mmetsp:Transcript_67880/g.126838  ORF Transcript_67880/g.126838 Transcript_67880/m.126838 type:complete len:212 (+) Transcript_67880:78-713(+)